MDGVLRGNALTERFEMSSNEKKDAGRIRTPLHVRWERVQQQLVPFVAVVLCAAVAWRLWRESPRVTAVGQVDVEATDVRAPSAGRLGDPHGGGTVPRLLDAVTMGQPLARVEQADGKGVEVLAPVSGQIIKVQREAGQSVAAGQTVYTIVAERGRTITTYLRADPPVAAEAGMPVSIRQHSDSGRTISAVVERVSVRYEPVPAAQLRDRKIEEWGRAVIISIPADADLRPGELVYIGWRRSSPGAAAPAGQARADGN